MTTTKGLGRRTGKTTAQRKRESQTVRDNWAAEYNADPTKVVITRKLKRNSLEAIVLDAADLGIDLGGDVQGTTLAAIQLHTQGLPTLRKLIELTKGKMAQAIAADVLAVRNAVLEDFSAHPLAIEMPASNAAELQAEIEALERLLAGMTAAYQFAYREGIEALKAPEVGERLATVWSEKVHPKISGRMTLDKVDRLRAEAGEYAEIIESLYTIHVGSLPRGESKALAQMFKDRPKTLPTIEKVRETTRRFEHERIESALAAEKAKAESRESASRDAALSAKARNPKRENADA